MKYENNRSAGLPKETMRKLEQIAMKACYSLESRGGIESRYNDTEDFPEVSILGIQKMLEDAYRLGKADGQQRKQIPVKFQRPDTCILSGSTPIDRNDPDSEREAVELALPTGFSDKAKALMDYLEGSAFIFAYKDHLVMTDEGLYLTAHGDGTPEAPLGCPRMVCDSWEEMESSLEEEYDGMKKEGLF